MPSVFSERYPRDWPLGKAESYSSGGSGVGQSFVSFTPRCLLPGRSALSPHTLPFRRRKGRGAGAPLFGRNIRIITIRNYLHKPFFLRGVPKFQPQPLPNSCRLNTIYRDCAGHRAPRSLLLLTLQNAILWAYTGRVTGRCYSSELILKLWNSPVEGVQHVNRLAVPVNLWDLSAFGLALVHCAM